MNEKQEIGKGLLNIIISEDCTPLEMFNIKMYMAIHNMSGESLKSFVEKEINEINKIKD